MTYKLKNTLFNSLSWVHPINSDKERIKSMNQHFSEMRRMENTRQSLVHNSWYIPLKTNKHLSSLVEKPQKSLLLLLEWSSLFIGLCDPLSWPLGETSLPIVLHGPLWAGHRGRCPSGRYMAFTAFFFFNCYKWFLLLWVILPCTFLYKSFYGYQKSYSTHQVGKDQKLW